MWYVNITGISKEQLEFLGFVCVAEDTEFMLYRDYRGEEFIVRKAHPLLLVEDPNDVSVLRRFAKQDGVFRAPPRERDRDGD